MPPALSTRLPDEAAAHATNSPGRRLVASRAPATVPTAMSRRGFMVGAGRAPRRRPRCRSVGQLLQLPRIAGAAHPHPGDGYHDGVALAVTHHEQHPLQVATRRAEEEPLNLAVEVHRALEPSLDGAPHRPQPEPPPRLVVLATAGGLLAAVERPAAHRAGARRPAERRVLGTGGQLATLARPKAPLYAPARPAGRPGRGELDLLTSSRGTV